MKEILNFGLFLFYGLFLFLCVMYRCKEFMELNAIIITHLGHLYFHCAIVPPHISLRMFL